MHVSAECFTKELTFQKRLLPDLFLISSSNHILFNAVFCLFQFNVQRLQDAHSLSQPSSSAVGLSTEHGLYLQGSAHSSGGSVSSTGGASPNSPLRPGKEEDCSLHGRSSTEGSVHKRHLLLLFK